MTDTGGVRTASRPTALVVALLATLLLAVGPAGAQQDPAPGGRPEPRIVDGTVAPPGSWPTVAALVLRGRTAVAGQFCGATAIDRSWVLTAAHCVRDGDWAPRAADIDVLVGTQDLRSGGTRLPVAEIRVHPSWNVNTVRNDLAVLRLATPIPVSTPLQALAAQGADPGINSATAAGWGSTDPEGEQYPVQLRQATMLTAPSASCAQASIYHEGSMMCAIGGVTPGSGGPCFGDSGGPLVTGPTNDGTQIGISSWIIECGQYQTYFTRVAAFRTWIDRQTDFGPHSTASPFVTAMYRDLFGRAPSSAELSRHLSWIAGGQSAAGAAAGMLDGPTYSGRAGGVARLYQAIFLRRPETGGMAFWMGEATRGVSLKRIADQMVRAKEFTQRYGTLGHSAFVDLVYENVLGRSPSSADRAFWVGELQSGRRSRGQVMVGFSESKEFKGLTDPWVRVTAAFHGLVRRVPTSVEMDRWRGQPTADIAAFLLESYAYAARY